MKTVTTPLMTKTIAAILTTLLCLANAGCSTDQPTSQDQVEVASPTGCLKSKGRYYDPKVKECVQVDDRQIMLELDAYRQVNKLAEEGKISEGEYSIGFSSYISLDQAEEFWAELRDQGGQMLGVFGRLPASVHGGCGWHHRFDVSSEDNTIRGMLMKSLETMEANPALSGPVPEVREAIFEDDLCRIYSMWLTGNPSVIRDFWNRHLDDIQGIRPQITDLDKAMPDFGPLQPFPEEEE